MVIHEELIIIQKILTLNLIIISQGDHIQSQKTLIISQEIRTKLQRETLSQVTANLRGVIIEVKVLLDLQGVIIKEVVSQDLVQEEKDSLELN